MFFSYKYILTIITLGFTTHLTVYVDPFGFTLMMQCLYWKIRDFKYDSKFLNESFKHSFCFFVDQVKISCFFSLAWAKIPTDYWVHHFAVSDILEHKSGVQPDNIFVCNCIIQRRWFRIFKNISLPPSEKERQINQPLFKSTPFHQQ